MDRQCLRAAESAEEVQHMIPTNAILIVAGIVCVYLSGFAVRRLIPREGRPASTWTNTDARAATVSISLISLALVGVGMILKGIFA
jgi:hypothetical protein